MKHDLYGDIYNVRDTLPTETFVIANSGSVPELIFDNFYSEKSQ